MFLLEVSCSSTDFIADREKIYHRTVWITSVYLGLHHAYLNVRLPIATITELHQRHHRNGVQKMSDLPPVLAVQNGNYTIRQKSSGRFLDAYENAGNDFRLVTRPAQDNDTQVWEVVGPNQGVVWTLRQESSGRFLDAHENEANDFRLVTRPAQNNDSQRWLLPPDGVSGETRF